MKTGRFVRLCPITAHVSGNRSSMKIAGASARQRDRSSRRLKQSAATARQESRASVNFVSDRRIKSTTRANKEARESRRDEMARRVAEMIKNSYRLSAAN